MQKLEINRCRLRWHTSRLQRHGRGRKRKVANKVVDQSITSSKRGCLFRRKKYWAKPDFSTLFFYLLTLYEIKELCSNKCIAMALYWNFLLRGSPTIYGFPLNIMRWTIKLICLQASAEDVSAKAAVYFRNLFSPLMFSFSFTASFRWHLRFTGTLRRAREATHKVHIY